MFSLHKIQNISIQGEWVGPGDVCIHDKLYSMIILIVILIIIVIVILLIFFIYYTMDSCIRLVNKRNKRRRLRKYRQFGSLKSSLSTNTGGRSFLMNKTQQSTLQYRFALLESHSSSSCQHCCSDDESDVYTDRNISLGK